jgi:lincosamide and streptogramin A transport system ATP-binding/permease protein
MRAAAARTANWSDRTEASKIGTHVADRGYVGHKAAKMMKRAKSVEARQHKAIKEKEGLLRDIDRIGALKLTPLTWHSETLAEAEGLSVSYGEKAVFRNLSFRVRRGDRLALLGANGSGKSSLLRLMAGEDVPREGGFVIAKGLRVSYVPQDTTRLCGGLRDYAHRVNIDLTQFFTILRNLGLERAQLEKDMRELSEGQKKKVLIARSLSESAHLYLWDEPLNYIDIDSRMQTEQLLRTYRPTMVFVEHDNAFVDAIATKRLRIE